MITALWLLALQGVIGAFDTLYFHEWRARLPGGVPATAPELRLHAWRDFFYAVLFGTLPWIAWAGSWTAVLVLVIMVEIVLTFSDFVVEIRARRFLGDVYGGERVTHAIMGIVYGAMIAELLPTILAWARLPTGLVGLSYTIPDVLKWTLTFMAAGVFLSGVRDLYAAFGLPGGSWPWSAQPARSQDQSA